MDNIDTSHWREGIGDPRPKQYQHRFDVNRVQFRNGKPVHSHDFTVWLIDSRGIVPLVARWNRQQPSVDGVDYHYTVRWSGPLPWPPIVDPLQLELPLNA